MNGTPDRCPRAASSRSACRARRAAWPRAARAHRTAAGRRHRRTAGSARGPSVSRSATPSSPAARSGCAPRRRARASRVPCSCSMSGLSASMVAARKSSSASTDSATLRARPRTRAPSVARRLEADMPRRRRKEHEADQVGAGVERDVDRVRRHQAANLDLYGHFRGSLAAVLARPEVFVLPVSSLIRRANPQPAGGGMLSRGAWSTAGRRPGRHDGTSRRLSWSFSARSVCACGFRPPGPPAPLALPHPGRDAAHDHAGDDQRQDQDIERHCHREGGVDPVERVEGDGDGLPVGDRERDDDDRQRDQDQRSDDLLDHDCFVRDTISSGRGTRASGSCLMSPSD